MIHNFERMTQLVSEYNDQHKREVLKLFEAIDRIDPKILNARAKDGLKNDLCYYLTKEIPND